MRAVFDTNVVVSVLLFGGLLEALRSSWSSGALIPVVSDPSVSELRRVFGYAKFRLTDAHQRYLVAEYLAHAEYRSPPPPTPEWANACRDVTDLDFLALAASAAVPLVTGDREIARLKGTVPISVLSAREALAGLRA